MANNIKINNPLGVQPQQKKGSGFVNLNKILQANVGNKLGQTVAQGIGQGVGQVQQGIGQLKNEFQQESEKQNLASVGNKQAVSDALKNISAGQTDVSDELANQFGTFRAGQYAGPKDLDQNKFAQVGSRASEVQDFGTALASGGDKTRVLQAFAGQGPYTSGQTRLDSLLLGQGPQAKQQLAEARQQTRGLTQQVGKEQDAARQVAQLRTGEAQQFGQEVQKQLAAPQTEIQTAIDQLVSQKQGDLAKEVERYQQDPYAYLGTNQVKTYGLDPRQYGGIVDFLSKDALNRSSLANQGQLQQLDALSKLSGQSQNFIGDPTAVGTGDQQKFANVNSDQLRNAIMQQQENYRGDLERAGISDTENWVKNLQAKVAKNDRIVVHDKNEALRRMKALQDQAYKYKQVHEAPQNTSLESIANYLKVLRSSANKQIK